MKRIAIIILTILLIGIIIIFITKIDTTKAATTTLAAKVISLSKGTSWSSGASGVYQTNGHEYRYVGANVNNYVKFNDDMYRIIGVFDSNSTGVSGNLVKLIRARSIGSYSWGCTNTASAYTTYSEYNNNWQTANANILLNEYFLKATSTSTTYKACTDWTYYSSGNNYKTNDCSDIIGYGIKSTERNYIQPVTWFLKGYEENGHSRQQFYTCERSDTTTISACAVGGSLAPAKVTNKYIGLMYASDYLYASSYYSSSQAEGNNDAYYGNQNWLFKGYEWTITPYGNHNTTVFNVTFGDVNYATSYYPRALRPTFYLKSTVNYVSGSGTFNSPFIISM